MSQGILYGIGVGPGDPELMTRKAVRILEECDVVAVPQSEGNDKTAVGIAAEFIGDKPLLYCDMPMTRDKAKMEASHTKAADDICALLDEGKTVAFLTLGDPTIYSTSWYVHKRVQQRGYDARLVPGVPSFCAAAAEAGIALVEGGEMLHIIPASHIAGSQALHLAGTKVLMKSGKSILNMREALRKNGSLENAVLVQRSPREAQRVNRHLDEQDEKTGDLYISIVKEGQA